ncbi:MAG: hypothetical protein ACRET6_14120 [Burkholderiales bacterium]
MKKSKKAVRLKRVARKRPTRIRKAASAARTRPAWEQRLDSDAIRRAVDDGMQDLRMKKP